MAQKYMKNVFLSASIPDQSRHPKYYATADVIAIRDAVRALATVVIPNSKISMGRASRHYTTHSICVR